MVLMEKRQCGVSMHSYGDGERSVQGNRLHSIQANTATLFIHQKFVNFCNEFLPQKSTMF